MCRKSTDVSEEYFASIFINTPSTQLKESESKQGFLPLKTCIVLKIDRRFRVTCPLGRQKLHQETNIMHVAANTA
jgi:hypothetical protein